MRDITKGVFSLYTLNVTLLMEYQEQFKNIETKIQAIPAWDIM